MRERQPQLVSIITAQYQHGNEKITGQHHTLYSYQLFVTIAFNFWNVQITVIWTNVIIPVCAILFVTLYSGLAPTLMRDVPFSGIYLMFYTQMKLLAAEGRIYSAAHISFVNGVVAGSLAAFVTQPADVIKTNMQLYPSKYGSLKNVITLVYTESGFTGFWRGMVPRMLRRTFVSAMSWTVYEEIMRAYNIKT